MDRHIDIAVNILLDDCIDLRTNGRMDGYEDGWVIAAGRG